MELVTRKVWLDSLTASAASFFVLLNSFSVLHHVYNFSLYDFFATLSTIIRDNLNDERIEVLNNGREDSKEKQVIIMDLTKTILKELIRSYSR